jgi:hypothetical protein
MTHGRRTYIKTAPPETITRTQYHIKLLKNNNITTTTVSFSLLFPCHFNCFHLSQPVFAVPLLIPLLTFQEQGDQKTAAT